LLDGVVIRGSVFTRGGSASDIEVYGSGVSVQPVNLPPLDGSDEPVRLPSIISSDDLRFYSGSTSDIQGLVLARDDFDVRWAEQEHMALRIEGHVAGRDLRFRPREEWEHSEAWWDATWLSFWAQRLTGIAHFPEWLVRTTGLDIEPHLTLVPDKQNIRYHYYRPGNPVYVPHEDDDGLRWNVVRLTVDP
jgi:hypothetical protein